MPARAIAGRQNVKDCRRSEYVDISGAWPRLAAAVAPRGPAQQRIAADRESALLQRDEGAVRQCVDVAPVQPLGAAVEALAVQHLVHLAGCRPRVKISPGSPALGKGQGILAAAFETGPMPGRKRCRLVEKE